MSETLIESPSVRQSYFLDQFETSQRSAIANQFFAVVRSSAPTADKATPEGVLVEVKADCLLRLSFADTRDQWTIQRKLLSLLDTTEARVYAKEVIARESLPPQEKQRLRLERQAHFRREYLKAQPPTERQIRYLKSLGCSVLPENRWEASVMIDGHVKA